MMNIYNTIKDIANELNVEVNNILKLFKNKLLIMMFMLIKICIRY